MPTGASVGVELPAVGPLLPALSAAGDEGQMLVDGYGVVRSDRCNLAFDGFAELGRDEGEKTGSQAGLFRHPKIPAIAFIDEGSRAVGKPFDDKLSLVAGNQAIAVFAFAQPRTAQDQLTPEDQRHQCRRHDD
jgi:hypothetical protein